MNARAEPGLAMRATGTTAPGADAARARGVQTLDRAVGILQLLAAHQACGMSLTSIVAETGLDRTTAYRIASSLVEAGMASRDTHKRYRLGIEAMVLGMASMQRPPLVERSIAMMKALARQSGGHVMLSIQSGDYSHCLHLEPSEPAIPGLAHYVGRMLLLGTGISGVAQLASFDERGLHAHYVRHRAEYHDRQLTETALRRVLHQTREAGFAYVASRGLAGVGIGFQTGSCGFAGLNVITAASEMPRARSVAVAALMRMHVASYRP